MFRCRTLIDVLPARNEWEVVARGPVTSDQFYPTRDEAVKSAEHLALDRLPCDLMIHDQSGIVREHHAYE